MDALAVWLPPAVTIAVLVYVLRDLKADSREMRNEIGGLRSDMRIEIGSLRSEMNKETGELRSEIRELSGRVSNIDSRVSRIEGLLESVFRERQGDLT